LQLDALGDPTRREILERLAAGPLAVGEIARLVPVSRPAVSQHLRVLKDSGLVTDRAEQHWTKALQGLQRVIEHSRTRSERGERRAPRSRRKERSR